jgi:hypothetical protein
MLVIIIAQHIVMDITRGIVSMRHTLFMTRGQHQVVIVIPVTDLVTSGFDSGGFDGFDGGGGFDSF